MASGRTSPNQPQGGATNISSNSSPRLPSLHDCRTPSPAPASASSAPNPEVSWPGRTLLFSGSLKKASGGNSKDAKSDYLDRASELICLAVQKEKEQDFQAAFSCYRSGVDLLLQGVQGWFWSEPGNISLRSGFLSPCPTPAAFYSGEPSPTRREAVKKKTAEYLMRAEQISSQHLRSNMGQGSAQRVVRGGGMSSDLTPLTFSHTRGHKTDRDHILMVNLFCSFFFLSKALGAQCCPSTSRGSQQNPSEELRAYRVLGVIDKVSSPSANLATWSNVSLTITINNISWEQECKEFKWNGHGPDTSRSFSSSDFSSWCPSLLRPPLLSEAVKRNRFTGCYVKGWVCVCLASVMTATRSV